MMMSLADLMPSQDEINLLATLKEYHQVNMGSGDSGASFVKYNRSDPFFTP